MLHNYIALSINILEYYHLPLLIVYMILKLLWLQVLRYYTDSAHKSQVKDCTNQISGVCNNDSIDRIIS